MIDLRILKIDEIKLNEEKLNKLLPEEYLDKVSRFKFRNDQLLNLGSAYFKYKYIGEGIYFNEYGKPLKDGIYFNISHSKEYVIFALYKHKIGIDIEYINLDIKDDLIRYALNEQEYNNLKNKEEFYELWTKKEAVIKCEGVTIGKIKNILEDNKYNIISFKYDNYYVSLAYEGKHTDINIINEEIDN